MSQISNMSVNGGGGGGAGIVVVTFPSDYPYQIVSTDYAIIVDTTESRTIELPAAPIQGVRYFVKDGNGLSNSNPITVDGNGNTIDDQPNYIISFTWGFVSVLFNGLQWNVSNN